MKIEGPIPSCEFCEILSTGEQSLKLEVEGFPSRCNYRKDLELVLPPKPTFTQVGIVGICHIPYQSNVRKLKHKLAQNRTCVM